MKKLSAIIILLALVTGLKAQDQKGLTKVNSINGVPVYIMAEPVNEYKVVFTKNTGLKLGSLASEGSVNEGISDKIAQFVTRISREAEKKNKDFDAILYTSGKRAAAIKFNEEVSEDKEDLAYAQVIDGIRVFVMSEPVNDFEVVANKNGGAKLSSFVTSGWFNRTISGDVSQFVKRIQRENSQVEGVVYNAGKRAIGIAFE